MKDSALIKLFPPHNLILQSSSFPGVYNYIQSFEMIHYHFQEEGAMIIHYKTFDWVIGQLP